MIYWIDIEDSDGVKQGFGPILSAQAWTHTAQLDRAGTKVLTTTHYIKATITGVGTVYIPCGTIA